MSKKNVEVYHCDECGKDAFPSPLTIGCQPLPTGWWAITCYMPTDRPGESVYHPNKHFCSYGCARDWQVKRYGKPKEEQ